MKFYQSNEDVTHYLSNETHNNPAAVPKITSNFVPDCISLSARRRNKKGNPWKKKKKTEKIIFDA